MTSNAIFKEVAQIRWIQGAEGSISVVCKQTLGSLAPGILGSSSPIILEKNFFIKAPQAGWSIEKSRLIIYTECINLIWELSGCGKNEM